MKSPLLPLFDTMHSLHNNAANAIIEDNTFHFEEFLKSAKEKQRISIEKKKNQEEKQKKIKAKNRKKLLDKKKRQLEALKKELGE